MTDDRAARDKLGGLARTRLDGRHGCLDSPADWPALTDAVRGQVETVLGRGASTAVEEQEAELVATLILERATRPAPAARAVAPSSPEVTAAQQRIEAIWGRRPARPWS